MRPSSPGAASSSGREPRSSHARPPPAGGADAGPHRPPSRGRAIRLRCLTRFTTRLTLTRTRDHRCRQHCREDR
ncbi:protein of unknown function [Blastococcus saxobsidens DD2]|uniref:Uncharacterized protein n=1 Tax=Blastococcus saxobsidens (strain DD2) TaxID=1146883 RepID=H6RLJ6_BLASD|nr:protein of unknown function [Blastococcus saxobsidens DD2]